MATITDLHILNVGNVSSFRLPGYGESIPDTSLSSENIVLPITSYYGLIYQHLFYGIVLEGAGRLLKINNTKDLQTGEESSANNPKVSKERVVHTGFYYTRSFDVALTLLPETV